MFLLFSLILQIRRHLVAKQCDRIFCQIARGKEVCDVVSGFVDQGLEEDYEGAQALDVFRVIFGKGSGMKQKMNIE